MNDDTSNGEDLPDEGVLRPFGGFESPDLPPVEPSKVVPEPPVSETPPPPPPPPPPATPPTPPPTDGPADDGDDDVADPEVETETAVDAEVETETETERAADVVHDAPEEYAAAAVAGDLPDAKPAAGTITLPRKAFLVGLGALLAVLAVVVVLWQTADGDDEPVVTEPSPTVETTLPDEEAEPEEEPVSEDPGSADAAALADAEAEIDALNEEIKELGDRPPPALPGDSMRRVIVSADAKFVDALDDSVAVVGAFGGVSLIDPETNRVVAAGSVGDAATRVLRTDTSVWVTNYADNQVLRLDPATNSVDASFTFVGPDGIDKDGDSLVVASYDGALVARINPSTGDLLQAVDVGGAPTAVLSHPDLGLWATIFDTGEIVEIDRESFEIVQRFVVGKGPVGLSADDEFLWVANNQEGTVAKIDPAEGSVVWTAEVGEGPSEVVSVDGSVWVTVTIDGALVQLDAEDGTVLTRTPLGGASAGGGPTGLSYANGSLWVAMQGEQSVVRIDLE